MYRKTPYFEAFEDAFFSRQVLFKACLFDPVNSGSKAGSIARKAGDSTGFKRIQRFKRLMSFERDLVLGWSHKARQGAHSHSFSLVNLDLNCGIELMNPEDRQRLEELPRLFDRLLVAIRALQDSSSSSSSSSSAGCFKQRGSEQLFIDTALQSVKHKAKHIACWLDATAANDRSVLTLLDDISHSSVGNYFSAKYPSCQSVDDELVDRAAAEVNLELQSLMGDLLLESKQQLEKLIQDDEGSDNERKIVFSDHEFLERLGAINGQITETGRILTRQLHSACQAAFSVMVLTFTVAWLLMLILGYVWGDSFYGGCLFGTMAQNFLPHVLVYVCYRPLYIAYRRNRLQSLSLFWKRVAHQWQLNSFQHL
jgi:hypothetical protein